MGEQTFVARAQRTGGNDTTAARQVERIQCRGAAWCADGYRKGIVSSLGRRRLHERSRPHRRWRHDGDLNAVTVTGWREPRLHHRETRYLEANNEIEDAKMTDGPPTTASA